MKIEYLNFSEKIIEKYRMLQNVKLQSVFCRYFPTIKIVEKKYRMSQQVKLR